MSGIGIIRSNGIELIDVTVRDGSIFPSACPGGLTTPCNTCTHAYDTGAHPANPERARENHPPISFIICLWHEK